MRRCFSDSRESGADNTLGDMEMTLRQAFELVVEILKTMENGEIRLFVKNGEIRHINKTEEVFLPKGDLTKF